MKSRTIVIFVIVFGTMFLPPVRSFGQKIDNLSVTGAVISRTRKDLDNEFRWSYLVQLTLLNKGTEPLLLYDCFKSTACSHKVTFLTDDLSSDGSGTHLDDKPYFSASSDQTVPAQFWSRITDELQAPQPTSYILTISPQIPYQTIVGFDVNQKFKISPKAKGFIWENDRAIDEGSGKTIAVSETSKFVIEYRFVPMESLGLDCENARPQREPASCLRPYKNADLLASLAGRWRNYGFFPLDSSGSFTISTSPIPNLEDHDAPPKGR